MSATPDDRGARVGRGLRTISRAPAAVRGTGLESGKRIIVSTIQKLPVIQNQIEELPDKRFALLIDEAHGSQGGEASAAIKKVLDILGTLARFQRDVSFDLQGL